MKVARAEPKGSVGAWRTLTPPTSTPYPKLLTTGLNRSSKAQWSTTPELGPPEMVPLFQTPERPVRVKEQWSTRKSAPSAMWTPTSCPLESSPRSGSTLEKPSNRSPVIRTCAWRMDSTIGLIESSIDRKRTDESHDPRRVSKAFRI